MNFKEGQPIYVQIAERLCDEVLAGTYAPDSRVPGVREYSALLEVNVNTTVKSYNLVAQRGVLYAKRGMGYYVSSDAQAQILKARRTDFHQHMLPTLFLQMRQLGVSIDEVVAAWKTFEQ